MKTKIVYTIVIVLILASWVGNYAFNRYFQLPEGGFLRHYIETRDIPSVAFDLLYVANKDDKRRIVDVRMDELPTLRFYPVQIHQELNRQTIYLLRGYYDDQGLESRPDRETLKLHSVIVQFSDGSMSEEDIGEIIVYREAWPTPTTGKSPVEMSSVMGSTDHNGSATIRTTKPVTLTGITSVWLEKLGDYFQHEISSNSDRGVAFPGTAAAFPLELNKGEAITVKYQYSIPRESPQALEVYNLLLKERFEDSNGQIYDYTVFANYLPYLSESQMRAYVREQRRQAE